ncbi:riboflavin synthase [Candidatus Nitrosacidococcus tergens]|uniref:Riboflavin synthase n=1 Tax=Candidatus Nitrosacidococcus tergens TaxID=553981 RepID=A0A7G1Q8D1_9GAMM|nr:riboflavin synthase [Candidatus Nitrosacidococcus tergens]CAB1274952.1 Riboflavin synthase [Candidatus Nitrosacidococcus tergens]
MFTGIIKSVGTVITHEKKKEGLYLGIDTHQLDLTSIKLGDSIAVSGVCLTVVQKSIQSLFFELSPETLACTTLGNLTLGDLSNLESALTLKDSLGGHLVSGHCDGIGTIRSIISFGESSSIKIEAPLELMRYIAKKGSICVDGVSLTVNYIYKNSFEINLIPHTLQATTFSQFKIDQQVNLEVDLIARYIESLFHRT